MMRRLLYIYVAIVAGLCVSCVEDDSSIDSESQISGYDQADLQPSFYADQISSSYFDFVASTPWELDLSDQMKSSGNLWLEVSPMSGGAGEQQLEITILESNETGESRTIDITITPNSGHNPITITVTQSAEPMPAQSTIMYFMGTHLQSYYNNNISDVKTAVAAGALGSRGQVLIFFPTTAYKATLYKLYEEDGVCQTEIIEEYSDATPYLSLDGGRMTEVILCAQEFAPAHKYNIVLSGHGTGWVPYSTTFKSLLSYSFDKDPNAMMTRYMGGAYDGYMEISELVAALEATSTKYGFLLFDMCLMSNIETIYQLRDVCDNVVASPAEVMGAGFPYKTVLPKMFTDDGASYDLAAVCAAYYSGCVSNTSMPYGTVAYCVTSELDDLAAKIKEMTLAGVAISTLQCYEKLDDHIFCDLGDYIDNACGDATLKEEFTTILNRAFPTDGRYHTTYGYTGMNNSGAFYIDSEKYSGVSTSAPSTATSTTWSSTDWAVATTP